MHLVLVTYGNVSRMNSFGRLARVLQAHGHTVTFVSSTKVRDWVDNSCEVVLLEQENRLRENEVFQQLERMGAVDRLRKARSEWIAFGRKKHALWLEQNEFGQTLSDLAPDLLLIDEELDLHIVVALSMQLPVAIMTAFYHQKQSAWSPPLGTQIVPKNTLFSRLLVSTAWITHRLISKLKIVTNRVAYRQVDDHTLVKKLASQRGIDLDKFASFHHNITVQFDRLPWIRFAISELALPPIDDREAYIGPLVDVNRRETAVDVAFEKTWEHLADVRGTRPLIYCAMGSMIANLAYFKRVIAAVAARPDWVLLLAAGRQTALAQFGPLPANVFVQQYVPQLRVLKHANVMLHHGGAGTIHECIASQVPMVCYPVRTNDLYGNAARIVYHKLGVCGDLKRDSAETIRMRIDSVLSEPMFKQRLSDMSAALDRYSEKTVMRRINQLAQLTAQPA